MNHIPTNLLQLISRYSPDKTALEIANEIGMSERWVAKKCKATDLPLRKKAPAAPKIVVTANSPDELGIPAKSPLGRGQKQPWPENMSFVDAQTTDGGYPWIPTQSTARW